MNLRSILATLAVLIVALCTASGAMADGTVTWGVSGVTPTMDTANGDDLDSSQTNNNTSVCPYGILCSPQVNPLSGTNPILPAAYSGVNPADAWHSASDLAVWNTGSDLVAPANGQVLTINVTGCAVEDTRSPSQDSQGTPVNTILFQALTPSGADWNDLNVSGAFQLPFCGNGTTANTVTSFQPIHMCISAGDALALHDTGGFVNDNGGAYYPQGIPLMVLAQQKGEGTSSFVGSASQYGPGSFAPGAGYATESDQEVTMQVVEGTGDDAYGLCPGGFADEPSANSNAIDCDYTHSGDGSDAANPTEYPDYPFCAGPGDPIPGSNVPSSGSSSSSTPSSSTSSSSSSSRGSDLTSAKGGGSPGAGSPSTPVITRLRFNPSRFVARRGSTITYRDSEPGLTTLRFYRVRAGQEVLVKTLRHQDKVNAGMHIGGLTPGDYLVRLTSQYRLKTGLSSATRIEVIARR